jgi:hypothetical protein
VRHLMETTSAVLAAERSATFGTIRESLHEREEERRRWARELHDDTLQQLGALQVLLTSALAQARAPDRGPLADAVRLATELVATQIGNLRQLITELRPAALDDLGLTPPLQALARRTEQLSGIPVSLHVSLRYADGVIETRLVPDVERVAGRHRGHPGVRRRRDPHHARRHDDAGGLRARRQQRRSRHRLRLHPRLPARPRRRLSRVVPARVASHEPQPWMHS